MRQKKKVVEHEEREGEIIKERRKKGMGEYAKTMKVGRGTPELKCREFRALEEVQEGWERCKGAENRVWKMFKEVSRSAGGFQKCRDGRPRGWTECRQKCRKVGNSAGKWEAYVGRGAWQDAGTGKKL